MAEKQQIQIDEALIRSFEMVDGDLELTFVEIRQTSAPDESLQYINFRMVSRESAVTAGELNLRIGYTDNVVLYRGNIGYSVAECSRGHRYSSRSCLLLRPLLKKIQLSPIWITCNIDNIASRKSIEKIGAKYVETLTMPTGYPFIGFYPEGARTKLRFRWDV